MSQGWIRTEGLTYSYTDDTTGRQQPALHGIDLNIDKGEYIAIIGQDRKSTRLNSSHSRRSRMPSSA